MLISIPYTKSTIASAFMRLTLLISLLFIFGRCIQEDPDVFSLKPGDTLPEFSVEDNGGNIVSTATLRGKVCLIAFVNTGCPDCRKELPEIESAYQQFKDNEIVRFIIISRSQGYESLTEYWTNNQLTIPYSAQENDAVFKKFASQNIPRIYIASPQGIIVFTSDDSSNVVAETISTQINNLILSSGIIRNSR